MKSGAIVSLLKYCYCTAMQWSGEDNECTHAQICLDTHTDTHTEALRVRVVETLFK